MHNYLIKYQYPSFSITTIMVKPNIQNKLSATNTHPLSSQTILSSTGESSDLLNIISYTSSRAGKCVYPRGCLCMHCTIRHSSRSVSAAKNSRKASPEPSSTSKEEESDEEEVSSSPRMPTVSRVTIDKLFYRVASLQLSATSSLSAPERRTYSMSWNNQIVSKKNRDIASGMASVPQAPISTSLIPYSTNYGTAELSFYLGGSSVRSGTYDMIDNLDTLVICDSDSLPQVS